MILFTSGFPYAGKTKFVKLLLDKIDHAIHIDPKDYYMENFEELNNDEQSAVGITAWEMSLERAEKCINKLPNKALIILDTCCAKINSVRSVIHEARRAGHNIYCIYVDSSLENRKSRAPGKDIESYQQRYADDFLITLPKLKDLADTFMIIVNDDDQSGLNKQADALAEIIKGTQSE